jgi:Transposase DDE domain
MCRKQSAEPARSITNNHVREIFCPEFGHRIWYPQNRRLPSTPGCDFAITSERLADTSVGGSGPLSLVRARFIPQPEIESRSLPLFQISGQASGYRAWDCRLCQADLRLPEINIKFARGDCRSCGVREQCTRTTEQRRTLTIHPEAESKALAAARARTQEVEYKELPDGVRRQNQELVRTHRAETLILYKTAILRFNYRMARCRNTYDDSQ